jgi:thioredoxin reductase (NADPH)
MAPDWDLVIIGGGPAGLTAAQYGARANLKVMVIEEMAPGGAVLLIDDLENYPGFPQPIKGFEFVTKMKLRLINSGLNL